MSRGLTGDHSLEELAVRSLHFAGCSSGTPSSLLQFRIECSWGLRLRESRPPEGALVDCARWARFRTSGTRHHLGGHEISYGPTFLLHVQHSAGYRHLWVLPDAPNPVPTWTISLELGRMVQGEVKMKVLVTQSCPTLCDPTDCSLPGSSVHGIFWAKILEWVAIPSSRGSSWPRDQNWVSWNAGRFFTVWATRVLSGL